jgi:hypothetical protein
LAPLCGLLHRRLVVRLVFNHDFRPLCTNITQAAEDLSETLRR